MVNPQKNTGKFKSALVDEAKEYMKQKTMRGGDPQVQLPLSQGNMSLFPTFAPVETYNVSTFAHIPDLHSVINQ